MELEEALAKIEELNTEVAGLKENAGKIPAEELKKIEQKAYNQGYDKAKNAYEAQINDLKKETGEKYVQKEEVEKMLTERERAFKTQKELLKMGIKNPEKAMKIIDDEDLETFGTEAFKEEDFKNKYGDVLVFKKEESTPPEPNKPFTKNNTQPRAPKLTAEEYAKMSAEERAKVPKEDRDALL